MLFLDLWFWQFAAVAVPGYWLAPARFKLAWLLVASLVFHYHFAGPAGMAPIAVLALGTWSVGLQLGRGRSPGTGPAAAQGAGGPHGSDATARRLFAGAVVVLVGALAFYKYSTFLVADVGAGALRGLGSALDERARSWQSPIAPLAISFFTFEFVHYLYEVRRHGRAPIRNPLHFAVFAIFFPTLASGPIKRFPDFVPQLDALSSPRAVDAWAGARRVVLGLFKKVCIADLLVEPISALEQVPSATAPGLALLAVLQGFRIYYDFAGYTDIALGLSRMLNLRVPENFDRPYWSTSIQDFWRRWHMSLSTWIRDYVYIPLGGNRGRRALHLVTAMALCGLWHGAAWNFVAWGAYHGVGLAGEAALRGRWPAAFEAGRVRSVVRWAVCYSFVTYGWLLFFYPLADVIRMTGEAVRWTIGT